MRTKNSCSADQIRTLPQVGFSCVSHRERETAPGGFALGHSRTKRVTLLVAGCECVLALRGLRRKQILVGRPNACARIRSPGFSNRVGLPRSQHPPSRDDLGPLGGGESQGESSWTPADVVTGSSSSGNDRRRGTINVLHQVVNSLSVRRRSRKLFRRLCRWACASQVGRCAGS